MGAFLLYACSIMSRAEIQLQLSDIINFPAEYTFSVVDSDHIGAW